MKKRRHSAIMPGFLFAGVVIGACWCKEPPKGISLETCVGKEISALNTGASFVKRQALTLGRSLEILVQSAPSQGDSAIYADSAAADDSDSGSASGSDADSAITILSTDGENLPSDAATMQADQDSATVSSKQESASASAASTYAAEQDADQTDPAIYCATTDLNLRCEPSSASASSIIATIPEGASVIAAGEQSDDGKWICVTYQNKTGWVYRKFLMEDASP